MKRDLLGLGGLWAAMVATAGFRGEFPLNDDWAYAFSVRELLAHGRFRLLGWGSMNLVAQTFWGALFSLPRGPSYEMLRSSTLALSLALVLATYALARELDCGRVPALFGAACVAVCPVAFALSHTFMTDVPFAAFSAVALLLLARALRRSSARWLAGGTALAVLATLVRQQGLALGAGYAVAAWRRERWRALIPLAGCGAAHIAWTAVLRATQDPEALLRMDDPFGVIATELRNRRIDVLAGHTLAVLAYLGLFAAPLFLALAQRPLRWLAAAVALAALAHVSGLRMPLSSNVLIDAGLGPLTLRDAYLRGVRPHWPHAPVLLWDAITGLSLASAGWLCVSVWRGPRTPVRLLCIASVLVMAAPLPFMLFDRYLVPLLPPLLCAALPVGEPRPLRLPAGAFLCAILGAFSVMATHDYLAWNRARWSAIEGLLARGVPADHIDGGFEYAGSRFFVPRYNFWRAGEYLISFGPVPGHEQIGAAPFHRWLPPAGDELLILRRR